MKVYIWEVEIGWHPFPEIKEGITSNLRCTYDPNAEEIEFEYFFSDTPKMGSEVKNPKESFPEAYEQFIKLFHEYRTEGKPTYKFIKEV